MTKKFIQIRGSGDIYEWTPQLEKRDDIDIIAGDDDDNTDTVAAKLSATKRLVHAPETISVKAPKAEKAKPAVPAGVTVAEV